MILLGNTIDVCYEDCWGFLRVRIRYIIKHIIVYMYVNKYIIVYMYMYTYI